MEHPRLDPLRRLALPIAVVLSSTLVACGGSDGNPIVDCTCLPASSASYVYVASIPTGDSAVAQPGLVSQYAVGADGALTPLGAASVSAGVDPTGIVSDPQGHYVYVLNQIDDTISQ